MASINGREHGGEGIRFLNLQLTRLCKPNTGEYDIHQDEVNPYQDGCGHNALCCTHDIQDGKAAVLLFADQRNLVIYDMDPYTVLFADQRGYAVIRWSA